MPVNVALLNPGLAMARLKEPIERVAAARGTAPAWNGLADAMAAYRNAPTYSIWNRNADGLTPIDAAVTALQAVWPVAGAGHFSDPLVETLLRACAAWLGGTRPYITSWRDAAVRTLYWKVAWCYVSSVYARAAHAMVRVNNLAGRATGTGQPAGGPANPYGAPGYTWSAAPAGGGPHLLRGDSRGPLAIQASGGFQPRNLANPAIYSPWFSGAALGDTVSATRNQDLAIGASWQRGATAAGALPAWLNAALSPGGVLPLPAAYAYRGFVYEFRNLGAADSVRMSYTAYGLEEVFLAIPNACIHRWWVVRTADHHAFGPLPYPAGGAAPAGARWSLLPHHLP